MAPSPSDAFEEERAIADRTNAQTPAARTALKVERAREAAKAMREYEAEKRAVDTKTARLRALRLAKEAEGKPEKKKRPRKTGSA